MKINVRATLYVLTPFLHIRSHYIRNVLDNRQLVIQEKINYPINPNCFDCQLSKWEVFGLFLANITVNEIYLGFQPSDIIESEISTSLLITTLVPVLYRYCKTITTINYFKLPSAVNPAQASVSWPIKSDRAHRVAQRMNRGAAGMGRLKKTICFMNIKEHYDWLVDT